jgi:Domain of unknown function (DUF4432)
MATPRQLEVDQSLLKCVGKLSQLGGISHFTHADRKARGVSTLKVRTARGLELWVLPDKGMDICEASYRGSSLRWHSPNGIVHPSYYGNRGTECPKTFRWWVALHVWANHRRFSPGRKRSTARLSSFGARVIPFDLLSEDDGPAVPRNWEPLRTRTLIRATPTNCNARLSRLFRNSIGSIS